MTPHTRPQALAAAVGGAALLAMSVLTTVAEAATARGAQMPRTAGDMTLGETSTSTSTSFLSSVAPEVKASIPPPPD